MGNTALAYDWGFVPERFLKDPVAQVMTVWTAMFLHGSWLHIAGNMLFLWVFGDNVEDALGHGRYLLFYLAGGFLAAMAQCLAEPSAAVPMVGASGAIAAVLAGYVTLYPKARILVLFPVFVVFLFFEFLTKNGEASTLESNRPDPFAFAIDGLPDRFDDHRLVDSASKRGTL